MSERHTYTFCVWCDQPMLPPGEVKRFGEYDHASGCPRAASTRLPITKEQRERIKTRARAEERDRMVRLFRIAMLGYGVSREHVSRIVASVLREKRKR